MSKTCCMGYVTGAFDRTWKPVTSKEQFMELLAQPVVRQTIERLRQPGMDKGRKQSLKKRLPAFFFMGRTPDGQEGSRKKDNLVPTGRVMIDVDSEEPLSPALSLKGERVFESPSLLLPNGVNAKILLSHRTPGGYGLRLVLVQPEGMTIEEVQVAVGKVLGVPLDMACKDISRLSYACLPEDIFYLSEELFTLTPTLSLKGEGALPSLPLAVALTPTLSLKGEGALSSLPSAVSFADDNASSASFATKNALIPIVSSTASGNSPTAEGELASKGDSKYPLALQGEGWGEGRAVPYSSIISALTDQLGGAPAHGSRNRFIFAMACQLRHICNDDPEWILSVMPTFGEAPEKVRSTVYSACNRAQSPTMPKALQAAINVAKGMAEADEGDEASGKPVYLRSTPPPMPSCLPPLIAAITQNVPDYMVPSLSQVCFPALAAHVSQTAFRYIDNVLHEPSMMQVQVGKTAIGKGYINEPIRILTQDIEAEDAAGREAEEQWRKECGQLGANKKKPPRPELVIRMVSSNMTNAIFVQRIIDTDKHEKKYMFSKFNEIELLDEVANGVSGGRKEVSKVIRLAYDNDFYGQERVGAQSVSGKAPIRWNWIASSTVQNTRRYFRDMIADGTMNRIGFSYIEPQPRGEVPVTGIYEEEYEAALKPYIDNLKRRLDPTHEFKDVIKKQLMGTDRLEREVWQWRIADTAKPFVIRHSDGRTEVFCPEAYRLAEELNRENATMVILSDDQTFDSFTLRANVIAYKKAMILYLANGCRWDDTFDDFIRWSEQYDLWCKLNLFGDRAQEVMGNEVFQGKRKGPSNMLEMLPTRFTKDDLVAVRLRCGRSANCRDQLKQWKRRGFIAYEEDGSYSVLAPPSMQGGVTGDSDR